MAERFTTVAGYLDALEPTTRAEVDALRELVMDAEPALTEIVKWNSPSYVLRGEDRLTINAAGRGPVRLILHLGVDRAENRDAPSQFADDPTGLLTWHSDIRASLTAAGHPRDAVVNVIRAWLAFGA